MAQFIQEPEGELIYADPNKKTKVQELKEILQEEHDLLVGFSRIYLVKDKSLPYDILILCLLYYVVFERWDSMYKGSHVVIEDCVRHRNVLQNKKYGSAVG
eukprot:414626_1